MLGWQRGATASLLYRHHDNSLGYQPTWCAMASDWFQRTGLCFFCHVCGFIVGLAEPLGLAPRQEMPEIPAQNANLPVTVKLKVSWKEVMSIHSTLQHICFIYRQGHSLLPAFSSFIAKFPNDFARHHIPKAVQDSLTWWISILQSPSNSCSLLPRKSIDPGVWVDALMDWGIGVIIGNRWAAWKLKPSWKTDGRDIGWAESIALELSILWLLHDGHTDCDITMHGDNMGVIGAFFKGQSHSIPRNESLCCIASYLIPNNVQISPVYVTSTSNRANPISHSILGFPSLKMLESLQLPGELEPWLLYV